MVDDESEDVCPYMLITKEANCCLYDEYCEYKTIQAIFAVKINNQCVVKPTCAFYSQLWTDRLENLVKQDNNSND